MTTSQRALVILGVSLVLGVGMAGCGSDSTSPDAAANPTASSPGAESTASANAASGSSPEDDVTIFTCGRDTASGRGKAKVLIKNGTSVEANYVFNVVFVGKDGTKYASTPTPVIVPGVSSGRELDTDATSTTKISGPFTCEIADLKRTP